MTAARLGAPRSPPPHPKGTPWIPIWEEEEEEAAPQPSILKALVPSAGPEHFLLLMKPLVGCVFQPEGHSQTWQQPLGTCSGFPCLQQGFGTALYDAG